MQIANYFHHPECNTLRLDKIKKRDKLTVIMSADRKPEIYLNDSVAIEKCKSCRVKILNIDSTHPPYNACRLAKLEQELNQKPSFSQAASAYIDTSKIPANCPNGY